jgi:pyruvate formate lyase activating enzyme
MGNPLRKAVSNTRIDFPSDTKRFVREARYYTKLEHKRIRCDLCPRECVIDDRERGYCGVRENREGTYYTLVYSRPCSLNVDPIEKKPLFHFHPGSLSFSIATAGCNVNCKFCQNWQISQVRPEAIKSYFVPPDEVARLAKDASCKSIAYTYSEPTIFYEYMVDTADKAHEREVKSVVVTAGYIEQKPLIELCKKVDAIKVDLKSFREQYYQDIVKGELKPVLDSLITMRGLGVWTEIVYLVLPTLNDSENEIRSMCQWIKRNLGKEVPVHFTRFYPTYRMKNLPPTPISTLERAKKIADAEGLHFVYVGNVPGHSAENTVCPTCQHILIERRGYTIRNLRIKNSRCEQCDNPVPGIWDA